MSDNSITRVHYFEGQFLRTQDFVNEQSYHVAMRRRHNISHHTWGVVSGLELVLEEGNFSVQPGMAVDGYGRELILPQKKGLSAAAFIDKGSTELDVWLIYGLKSSDEAAAGYAGCGNGDRTSASFYRWQETAQVLLLKPDPDFPNRRMPKEVPIPDRNFSPDRTPPDNPELSWPVFLGQIINDPTNQQQPLAVKLDDRPYVGLVGEEITAPSGRARVQIGSDPVPGSQRRFGVFTRNQNASPQAPKWLSRFEIDVDGELTVQGNANVQGNLVMNGGAVEFVAGPNRDAAAPPWDIYHLKQGDVEELRIEMAAAPVGAIAGNNRVVIGAWFKGPDETGQEKEEFHPCLTIRDDCTVEVSGNLVVKGKITAKEIVGGQLSDAARNAAASALVSGILTTSARLPDLPNAAPPPPTLTGAPVAIASVDNFVDRLEHEEAFRNEFIEKMRGSTVLNVSMVQP
jgi:hypothetical protein